MRITVKLRDYIRGGSTHCLALGRCSTSPPFDIDSLAVDLKTIRPSLSSLFRRIPVREINKGTPLYASQIEHD